MKKLLLFFPVFLFLVSCMPEQPEVQQAKISNGLINAVLYLPDIEKGYYRGTRFDHSGIMAKLEYKGHNFFGQWFEKYDPYIHDAVMGPVEEFGQIGFNESKIGETFLKIGVGMLENPDDKPYSNFRLYPVKNAGKWEIKRIKNGLRYVHVLEDKEYAYRYEKRIYLVPGKPEMVIAHTFENTGKKPVETTVYNHIFPVIDNQPVGPDYTVIFPFMPQEKGDGFDDVLTIKGKRLVYLRAQKPDDRVYCRDLKGYGALPEDYDIRIENSIAGAGMRITCDRPLVRLAFWSSTTTVCPEPFIQVSAKPGEKFEWQIRFEFYTLK
ncbi:MAG TPA: hypothetical protein P5320_10605 [Bacteroidales bacterium]|nr:hypothetical protein [Bacteroidales bacterium]HOK75921.1 hypothetical protein [Bacteroidales bacterium]HOM41098.1 hypothetical protein [Bacteroidales bacterium]HPP93687.1 hypothetical protein [Bacteroidales bacterium]HRR17164.1 hypothetical protein [Bacteroidales bacterium]